MKKVLAFGDSVLKGISLTDGEYRVNPFRFTDLIRERLSITIDNRARMGSTVFDLGKMMQRAGQLLDDPAYDTVVLEYGGNDCDFDWQAVSDAPEARHFCKTEIGSFFKEYCEKIRILKEKGKQVLLLSLPPIDAGRYFRFITAKRNPEAVFRWLEKDIPYLMHWHEMFNLKVFEIGCAAGVHVLDISSCLLSKPNYTRFLCEDGIHLNTEGHRIVADAILGQLRGGIPLAAAGTV